MPAPRGDRVSITLAGPAVERQNTDCKRMNIIARGGWHVMPQERDFPSAYYRALESGMGIVVPVRDHDGQLVIAHGPASDESVRFEDFLAERPVWPGDPPILAIHVCAEGLSRLIHRCLLNIDGVAPCLFGMPVSDMPSYLDGHIPLFVRQSEHEPQPAFYEFAEGVWLDSFERDWFDERLIIQHLKAAKIVTVVSPEIHGRPHEPMWSMLSALQNNLGELSPLLQLCTDKPQEARAALGG